MSITLKIERCCDWLETLVVDGRVLAYQDVGSGPTVILAHCSAGTHRIWAPLIDALRTRYRVLAPDLLGYGKSDPWPINARLHPWSDVSAIVALAERAGEPVHLVGHSYGGTVALEAARALGARAKSLTLIEPIAFHLLRLTGRMDEWQELTDVGRRMTEALRLRRDRGAASVYMRYWVGQLRWWLMSPRARRRVLHTVGKVGAEFEALSGLSTTEGDYRSINAPTRLIAGARTQRPARAIVDELVNILPDAHLQVLERAGHMSPLTHPKEVAALVAKHIDLTEARVSHLQPTTWQQQQQQKEARPKRRSIA